MLFNSIEFFIFLPVVFALYWILKNNTRAQNILLLVASYIFYGWWDWRFLILIFLSTLVDYAIGLWLGTARKNARKKILWLSILFNIGLLASFKYFNFFAHSFEEAFNLIGVHLNFTTLNVILPVGISFYTFQSLSYTIDVYRNKIEPCHDVISYFAFVSFFAQLVAGPIERATHLLPQFYSKRKFDYSNAADGMRQILWGLFKKMVVADNCAATVNYVFENHQTLDGSMLLLGAFYFAIQVYGDFSGYSDIAIGTAKLFGFQLMTNFRYPYFATNFIDFWRRWHISLTTWFRDYVYHPLGGSRVSTARRDLNILVTFSVSGLWHGANYTYLTFGIVAGIIFIISLHIPVIKNQVAQISTFRMVPAILLTFSIQSLALIIFRSPSLHVASSFYAHMFSSSLFDAPFKQINKIALAASLLLFCVEWIQQKKQHGLEIKNLSSPFRWIIYYVMIFLILYYNTGKQIPFVYFQF